MVLLIIKRATSDTRKITAAQYRSAGQYAQAESAPPIAATPTALARLAVGLLCGAQHAMTLPIKRRSPVMNSAALSLGLPRSV